MNNERKGGKGLVAEKAISANRLQLSDAMDFATM
jgi:hypothetical protein